MGVAWKKFFNLVAFIAVVLVGLALMLSYIFKSGKLTDAFNLIAFILAAIVVGFYSFFYAWSRTRKVWYGQLLHMIIWVVAVVLMVIFLLLPLF